MSCSPYETYNPPEVQLELDMTNLSLLDLNDLTGRDLRYTLIILVVSTRDLSRELGVEGCFKYNGPECLLG
jgi:hypothetical protein